MLQFIGGIYLPGKETHMPEVMRGKDRHEQDGKLTYQYKKIKAALEHVKDCRNAVDIGAHVGFWSMHLVKHFQHVDAFEPIPLHAKLFKMNVQGNYTLHQVALGEKRGTVEIQVPEEMTGCSHIASVGMHPGLVQVAHPDREKVWRNIPIHCLDEFVLTDVDFIKIDVEGFERAVVQGAEQTIRTCKPVMVVEQKGKPPWYALRKDAPERGWPSQGEDI